MEDLRVKSLIALWENCANDHNVFSKDEDPPYVYASYLMRTIPEGWSPYETNRLGKTVFSAWLKAIGFFTIHRNSDNFPVFLEQVKSDFKWWENTFGGLKEQNLPSAREFLAGLSGRYMEGSEEVMTKCKAMVDTLADTSLFKDCSLQKELLRVAVSGNFVELTDKFLAKGLDINALYTAKEMMYMQHLEYNRYGFDSIEKGKDDTRRLGFFVRSPEMFDCLNANNCDWFLKDSSGENILSVLSSCSVSHYLSAEDRIKVLKKMAPLEIKEKQKDPQGFVWKNIPLSQRLSDVARVVGDINQYELRGSRGENFLHLLAEEFPAAIKKYINTKKGAALLDEEDKNGLLPIEYVLCNPMSKIYKEQGFIKNLMEQSLADGKRKLNWLNMMTKVVDDGINYSLAVSTNKTMRAGRSTEGQIPSSWWDLPDGSDRFAKIKTPEGQSFIRLLIEKNYKNGVSFNLYHQLNPQGSVSLENQMEFHKKAETKDELEVSYLGFLGRFAPSISYGYDIKPFDKELETFDYIVEKAISKGVDLAEINDSFLSGERSFSDLNPKKFETFFKIFDKMNSIKSLVERHRLNESFGEYSKKPSILKDAL